MKKSLFLVNFLLGYSFLIAQQKEGCLVTFTHENDFLGVANKDENYTGGAKLMFETSHLFKNWLPFIAFKKKGSQNIQRISLSGIAFTPQHLELSTVIRTDRPYASFTSAGFGNSSFDKNNQWAVLCDLTMGSIGYRGPGDAQAWIHKTLRAITSRPIPQGWPNQIGYPGAFAFNYYAEVKKRSARSLHRQAMAILNNIVKSSRSDSANLLFDMDTIGNREMAKNLIADFIYSQKKNELFRSYWVAASNIGLLMNFLLLGYQVDLFNINMGSVSGFGPSMPKLRDEIQSIYSLNSAAPSIFIKKGKQNFSFALYAKPVLKIVLQNSLLEGLIFNDKSIYTIPPSKIRRILFEFNTGVHFVFFRNFDLRYEMAGRSQEYKGGKSFHNWGGFTLGFSPKKWNPIIHKQ